MFLGQVTPGAARKKVALQMLAGSRWRTVQTQLLSRSSKFRFAVRLRGVGGHFIRVLKPAGAGHASGASDVQEVIVPGQRSIRSMGGAFALALGAVHVSAPKGAIARGKTLTISVGVGTGFGAEGGSSIAGGPYVVSTSQGEPRKPVTVTVGYDAGLLAAGEQPLLLHGWSKIHRWVPEPAVVNTASHTVTAKLESFSPLDVIDDATYYAGIVTGNRTDLPSGCGSAPRWVDEVSLPDSNQDPLPVCFSSASNEAEAVLNMVNNRGYAQVVTISDAKIDIAKSHFADSLEGEAATLFADLGSKGASSTFILGPGDSATVTIDRPAPQQAAQEVHIDQAPQVSSGAGELAWAVLSTASDSVSVPVDRVDCIMSAVYNASSSGRDPSSAIDQMHSCIDAAAAGTVKDLLEKLSYGLLVDDFFYKVIDLEGDSLYPPQTGFTIPGSNPTFTSPDIHISPLNLGTLPDGQTTTVQLTATGGTAPYLFYIWNEPANAAKVPSWVSLAAGGTLTIEPPEGVSGEVSFAVYAFDANGDHSPFAREEVRFQTFVGESGGGGPPGKDEGGAIQIATNDLDTCALLYSATVRCWGDNEWGQLGNGTTESSNVPVTVSGISDADDISAGCALLSGGGVECWGDSSEGGLGDGTSTGPETCSYYDFPCSTKPVQVSGITNATQVAGTCALLSSGSVECWGINDEGQLGDGTTTGPEECDGSAGYDPCSTTPVQVSGITDATSITYGNGHVCALLSGGSIDCWGWGGFGDLGNDTAESSDIPVAVSGITNAIQVSAGAQHTCALLFGGGLKCWGENEFGELGDDTTESSDIPVAVSGITNAIQVSAGQQLTCALLSSGTVECWGSSLEGGLGNGSDTGPEKCSGAYDPCSTRPIQVSGITDATAISSSNDTCALLSTRSIDCWGFGGFGNLGDGTTKNSDVPVAVTGIE
jgi:alpha-tubulin suppressor-like RCC1 family protein